MSEYCAHCEQFILDDDWIKRRGGEEFHGRCMEAHDLLQQLAVANTEAAEFAAEIRQLQGDRQALLDICIRHGYTDTDGDLVRWIDEQLCKRVMLVPGKLPDPEWED